MGVRGELLRMRKAGCAVDIYDYQLREFWDRFEAAGGGEAGWEAAASINWLEKAKADAAAVASCLAPPDVGMPAGPQQQQQQSVHIVIDFDMIAAALRRTFPGKGNHFKLHNAALGKAARDLLMLKHFLSGPELQPLPFITQADQQPEEEEEEEEAMEQQQQEPGTCTQPLPPEQEQESGSSSTSQHPVEAALAGGSARTITRIDFTFDVCNNEGKDFFLERNPPKRDSSGVILINTLRSDMPLHANPATSDEGDFTTMARARGSTADIVLVLGLDTDLMGAGFDKRTFVSKIAWGGGPTTIMFPWLYQQRLGLSLDQMRMYVGLMGCDGASGYPGMTGQRACELLRSNNVSSIVQLLTLLDTLPDGLHPATQDAILFTYMHRSYGTYVDGGSVLTYSPLPPGLGPLTTRSPSSSELDALAAQLPLPAALSPPQRRAAARQLANQLWLPLDEQPAAVTHASTLLGADAVPTLLPDLLQPLSGLTLRQAASRARGEERVINSVLFLEQQQSMAYAAAVRQLGRDKFDQGFPSHDYFDEVIAAVGVMATSASSPALRKAAALASGRSTAASLSSRFYELMRRDTEVAVVVFQESGHIPSRSGAYEWLCDVVSVVGGLVSDAAARSKAHELINGDGPLRWYTAGGEDFLIPSTEPQAFSAVAAWSKQPQYQHLSCYDLDSEAARLVQISYIIKEGVQAGGSQNAQQMVALVRHVTRSVLAAARVEQQQLIAQGEDAAAAAVAALLDPDAPVPFTTTGATRLAAYYVLKLAQAHGRNLLLLGDMAQALSCLTHTAASGGDASAALALAQLSAIPTSSVATGSSTLRWDAFAPLRSQLEALQQQAGDAVGYSTDYWGYIARFNRLITGECSHPTGFFEKLGQLLEYARTAQQAPAAAGKVAAANSMLELAYTVRSLAEDTYGVSAGAGRSSAPEGMTLSEAAFYGGTAAAAAAQQQEQQADQAAAVATSAAPQQRQSRRRRTQSKAGQQAERAQAALADLSDPDSDAEQRRRGGKRRG